MKAIIFDVETTGFGKEDRDAFDQPYTEFPEIIEAAWLELGEDLRAHCIGEFCQRYKPENPIQFGAMATHHILPSDLEGMPPSSIFSLPEVEYLIGHNIDFDADACGYTGKRICTLALARSAWPDLDSHTQSALLYALSNGPEMLEMTRDALKSAHSALADVKFCHVILLAYLATRPDITTYEDLYAASELARIPEFMTFGKYKGQSFDQIRRENPSYIKYALENFNASNQRYIRIEFEKQARIYTEEIMADSAYRSSNISWDMKKTIQLVKDLRFILTKTS